MRKSIDELNQVPPEFSDDSAKEYAPLPDEFNRFAPVVKKESRKPSSVRKVMLYLATTGLVTLGILAPTVRIDTFKAAEATPTPEIVETATPTPEPVNTPDLTPAFAQGSSNTATPNPTATPTPEPTPTPALMGKIHITIYSEVFDMETAMRDAYPSKVLKDELLDAPSFEGYPLPPLPEQEGYTALGYVLLANSGTAYLESLYTGEAEPRPIGTKALGDTLTVDDLGIVPQNVEGVYEAEIHVVWLCEKSDFLLQFYDSGELFGEYYVGFPVYSEQLVYLAPFPIPEREGKTFAGWCDADGHMIDAVTYFDFFKKLKDAQTLEDRDWKKPIPCKVYACWSDGSGGAPPPTPEPTDTPTPTPTKTPTPKPTKKPTPKPTKKPTPKPTKKPTPTPVTKYKVTCGSACSFAVGSYSGSKQVASGTKITFYGYSESMATGIFQIYDSSGTVHQVDATLYTEADGYYWYKGTYTVTSGVTINYVW